MGATDSKLQYRNLLNAKSHAVDGITYRYTEKPPDLMIVKISLIELVLLFQGSLATGQFRHRNKEFELNKVRSYNR